MPSLNSLNKKNTYRKKLPNRSDEAVVKKERKRPWRENESTSSNVGNNKERKVKNASAQSVQINMRSKIQRHNTSKLETR